MIINMCTCRLPTRMRIIMTHITSTLTISHGMAANRTRIYTGMKR